MAKTKEEDTAQKNKETNKDNFSQSQQESKTNNDHQDQRAEEKDFQEQHERSDKKQNTDKTKSENSQKSKISEEEKLKDEIQEQKDKYMRLVAEFENYKKRTSKERLDLFKSANRELMQALLPVIDDFDRAMKEIDKEDDDRFKGVKLIHNKLNDTLKAQGLTKINVKEGDKFDADIHEAVTQVPAPKPELKGKIVDVVEKGFSLGEKILRFPKVVTGK